MAERYSEEDQILAAFSDELSKTVTASSKKETIALASNRERFVKVANGFFRDTETASIWKTETANDGSVWLTRTDLSQAPITTADSMWSTHVDKEGKNVTLAYKQMPIKRFASSQFGFSKADAGNFSKFLINKVASEGFVKELIENEPVEKQEIIHNEFPELK